jgi:RNA polymerase sigma factor (sigma-70 family)
MQQTDDMDLLRQYAAGGCEEAFAILVARHVNLVYGAALRHVHNAAQAEEITQAVFIMLARKARSLAKDTILAGWLYQTVRFTAANFLRGEIRRLHREMEAHSLMLTDDPQTDSWLQIAASLDEAMGALSDKDRDIIVLRFLEDKSLSEVGYCLGLNEDATRMRINRALEKLRRFFVRKGVLVGCAILGQAVAAHSAPPAPAMVVASTIAAAHGSAATPSALALADATLHLMKVAKLKFCLGVAVTILTVAGLGLAFVGDTPRPGPAPGIQAGNKHPFSNVAEHSIAGRYKWIDGRGEFFIVLYGDHNFMNRDGTRLANYRWELAPDSLSVTWKKNTDRFTRVEADGVYVGANDNGGSIRIEKQPPVPLEAAAVVPMPARDVVASIQFGAQCQTNGLTPVNTRGGDGEIYPGSVGGIASYELVRKDNKPACYLYCQIAPAVKEPPMANAYVIVEFFDDASIEESGAQVSIQFDSGLGAYAGTQALNLSGSQTWKVAVFYLANPLFQKRQNAGGDFRIAARTPRLFVRSIKLVKNKIPTETIKFPAVLPPELTK